MIDPLIKESEWLSALSSLPTWLPPAAPTLVVAPHPDDETLGAGGLIATQRLRGIEVKVVAVTDGENCYPGTEGLAEVRCIEQEAALKTLGVEREKITRLQLPDSSVASKQPELIELLTPHVSSRTHIVAPWPGDFHPDHEACGRAAAEVARRSGALLTFYFFWAWHRGTTELLQDLSVKSLPLDDKLMRLKSEALLHHRSQLMWDSGDPILPDTLLAPARRSFEVFLVA